MITSPSPSIRENSPHARAPSCAVRPRTRPRPHPAAPAIRPPHPRTTRRCAADRCSSTCVAERGALTQQALGRRLALYDRAIDTHVSNLRRKLTAAGGGVQIRAVRGSGYELIEDDPA